MLKENCKCCRASYGKDGEWCELSLPNAPEGLCEFCDVNNKKWFISKKTCHA